MAEVTALEIEYYILESIADKGIWKIKSWKWAIASE